MNRSITARGRFYPVLALAALVLASAAMVAASFPFPGRAGRAQAGGVAIASAAAGGIGDWRLSASGGFGAGGASFMASPLVEYRGALYAGVSNENGAEVRVKQGGAWNVVSPAPGFDSANNMAILCMRVFQDRLYVGTLNFSYGCEIWRYDGYTWSKLVGYGASVSGGFGNSANVAAVCMEVYDNKLYVGTLNVRYALWPPSAWSDGGEVWCWNGASWSKSAGGGFGDATNYGVTSLKEYGGRLYAGTLAVEASVFFDLFSGTAGATLNSKGCQLWRLGAGGWEKVAGDGFTRTDNAAVTSMEVFKGKLYLGTLGGAMTLVIGFSPTVGIRDATWSSTGLCIYSYGGTNLFPEVEDGFESAAELAAFSMLATEADGRDLLLVGAARADVAGEQTANLTSILRAYDGGRWYMGAPDGFGNPKNMAVMSMANWSGGVWAGTLNREQGCEVWYVQQPEQPTEPVGKLTFYFAEGYTGLNFQEYICLGNPGSEPATATITYLYREGEPRSRDVSVPPNSRATVDVNSDAGPDQDVSARIESSQNIIAERPMYFNYNGAWTGGHDAVGATRLSQRWYFAEGYTGPGFEEWICVLNPGDSTANLTFYFQTQEEGLKTVEGQFVSPHSRGSFKVNDLLGGAPFQTSLMLASDRPIVAERPMYFDYAGTADWHWEGGHCVMGTPSLEKEYYFAEGTTRTGFEEWLTLQNPGSSMIYVKAFYQLGPGQGGPVERTYEVSPASRQTILVNDPERGVGSEKDVSVRLSCDTPFLAERPMYFSYSYSGLGAQGGHCVIGAPYPAPQWFLAEGYTGSGFHEWLCLQNPSDQAADVEINYYIQDVGALPPRTETVLPKTRKTVMVNEHAGQDYMLSCRVKVTSGPDIVVERPMYFIFRGWDGGHDVVGYAP
jgi:hypothetical protein